jgi:putative ABC transport system permease protein
VTWRDTFGTSIEAVRTHRLRSALTMLGILIGIGAVVLTLGLGQGARADVRDQIDELGTNVLVVSPGSSTDSSGNRGGFGSASTLTSGDAAALANDEVAPDVEAVAATATSNASLTVGETNWTTTLTGTTESWKTVRSRDVSRGRFLTAEDEEQVAAVVVLGPDTASELFSGRNPRGRDRHARRDRAGGGRRARAAVVVRRPEQQRRRHRAVLRHERAPRRRDRP